MPETDLYSRYAAANANAQDPILGDEYAERFATIERKLEDLWHRDTAQWIAEYLRDAHRAWEAGERDDPLCRCSNPRCPWKEGEVPYQLRRRETTLDVPEKTAIEQLKAYLKTHPDAIVIDEALEELRELRAEVSEELVEFNRDAEQELIEKDANTSVPMAEEVTNDPTLDAPGEAD